MMEERSKDLLWFGEREIEGGVWDGERGFWRELKKMRCCWKPSDQCLPK